MPAGLPFFPSLEIPLVHASGGIGNPGTNLRKPPRTFSKKNHLISAGSSIHDVSAGLHVQSKPVLRDWLLCREGDDLLVMRWMPPARMLHQMRRLR